jgi:dTMP kinase
VSINSAPVNYVAFEGIEGAGKSTVASGVAELLDDGIRRVVRVREPGGTSTGERIRSILLDGVHSPGLWAEALLFAAARAQLAEEVIGPALDAGAFVVSDRSVYSSLAYQGGGRGLGIDRVRAVNAPGLGPVWPQLVMLLRVDPDTGLERQHVADRIGAEGVAFQARVAAAFDELADAEPDRFLVIDATQPLDEVVAAARDAIGAVT